jgi:hypothetical protein
MMKKPKMSKGAAYKKTATHPMKGMPKVKAHPAKGGAAKGSKAKLTGKTSANFKKMIPVKAAKGHKGGKTKETAQENPFGAGETIKYGFSK